MFLFFFRIVWCNINLKRSMRYCTNCGEALKDDEKFCPNCGTPVEEVNKQEEHKENKVEFHAENKTETHAERNTDPHVEKSETYTKNTEARTEKKTEAHTEDKTESHAEKTTESDFINGVQDFFNNAKKMNDKVISMAKIGDEYVEITRRDWIYSMYSYFPIVIGWILVLIMTDHKERSRYLLYHMNQSLMIVIAFFIGAFFKSSEILIWVVIFWFMGIIGAVLRKTWGVGNVIHIIK